METSRQALGADVMISVGVPVQSEEVKNWTVSYKEIFSQKICSATIRLFCFPFLRTLR